MVADAQILVTGHQVNIEPFCERKASRCTVDVGIVNRNVVMLSVDLVVVSDILHLDVAEFHVRAERTSVFVFHVFTVFGCGHGRVDNESVRKCRPGHKHNECYKKLIHTE